MIEKMTGAFFTALAENRALIEVARKIGLPLGGKHFVGGQRIDETLAKVRELNVDGLAATVDCLGEFIETPDDAKAIADECIEVIQVITAEGVDAQVSLKLSSVGLQLGEAVAIGQMRRILEVGRQHGCFVTINMEEAKDCPRIIACFKELRKEFDGVGIALQANLYRSRFDIEDLESTVRVVKGAYQGDEETYIDRKALVDVNYFEMVKANLSAGRYTQIATHDEAMIERITDYLKEANISESRYEFQMLQGMREERQKQLTDEGHRVVIYVPHGHDWYTYLMKRLAERPANIGFTLFAMMRR
ncbi:proline dehydrogenase family protein [Exiguobacterium flavidum]|uniref:proline dehydrogenase family protein n=1 Tax=Exiguobacterium flavidum TaxID=2184695 RepID=UPI000DF79EF3|nr:proline dehydrogenase family protein [Exiguobacterium flavidum]